MGLKEKRDINNSCFLGSWEITEDIESLKSMVRLDPDEIERINNFRSYARRLEYLSVRVLLKNMIGRNARIIYDHTNKPFIKDNSYQISISHSYKLTSILLSTTNKVGIDLEFMSHRISKISHKFINQHEVISENPDLKRYHLYIHWCAKEALYKICDKGQLNFKENMFIEPFEVNDSGSIKGTVKTEENTQEFDLSYFKTGNYITAFCYK
ncbi:MAG: 4'-phosphopantetheinyl transferase superfamily protein [Bacteroidota bacterium]|nr:4'-phosphopantetheinyl transferase superfamily protein [Bacteroidota bacterium]